MGKKNKKGHRQQKSLPVQPEPEPQLQKVAFDPIQPSYKTAPTLSPLNSGNGKLSGRDLHTTTPLSMRGRQRQGQVGTPRSEDADASVLLFGGGKLAAVRGQVQAVAVSLCLLGLIHLNCVLWADYIGLMLWAFVLSEAMRIGRERYLYSLRELHGHLKEHNSSGVVYWLLRATGAVHAAEVRHSILLSTILPCESRAVTLTLVLSLLRPAVVPRADKTERTRKFPAGHHATP